MNERNPYAVPSAAVADVAPVSAPESRQLQELAGGQRMVVFSIMAGLFSAALVVAVAFGMSNSRVLLVAAISLLPLLVLGIVGVGMVGSVRITHVLWSNLPITLLVAMATWIPLLNLAVMLFLNSSASKRLRSAGYTVGWLGARVGV